MNPIPASVRSHQHQKVARASSSCRDQSVAFNNADAHGIHQGIVRIEGREIDFTAHIRDAQAITVGGDSPHHTVEKIAVAGFLQGPESQGIEQGNGASPHSEDVPHNSAYPRGRPLERLDSRGVIVGLHLHHHRQPIADVHRPGILLTSLDQNPLACGRKEIQQQLGVLIAAVLAPQCAEHPQLYLAGLSAQSLNYKLVLGFTEGDFIEDFFGDGHA